MNLKPSDFGGLFSAQRLLVVGANGAGKTWFAKRLGAAVDVPVTHNDALALTTRWSYRPRDAVDQLRDRVALGSRWIIEGGPSVLHGVALERAEMIIWLDMPRHLRLLRVMQRSLRYLGRQRPEHPVGNRDWPGLRQARFMAKTWTSDDVMREKVQARLETCTSRVVHLKTTREVGQILGSMPTVHRAR